MSLRRTLAVGLTAGALVVGVVGVVGTGRAGAAVTIKDATIDGSVNAFLRTNYVEVGSRPNGTFGSNTTVPDGTWHPNDTGHPNQLGFRADREKNGWGTGTDDGDFFLPGTPIEVYALSVDGTQYVNRENKSEIVGSFTGSSTTGDPSATWTSSADTAGIALTQTYSLPTDGSLYIDISVTLTNHNGSSSEVYYLRAVDADNCRTRDTAVCDTNGDKVADNTGLSSWRGYQTWNKIETQLLDGDSTSMVSAQQTDGSAVALLSADSQSSVYSSADGAVNDVPIGFATLYQQPRTYTSGAQWADGYPVWPGNWFNKKGEEFYSDDTIGLIIHRTLAAGASSTFTMRYLLSLAEINAAGLTRAAVTANSPAAIAAGAALPAVGYSTNPSTVAGDWTTEPTCGVYAAADTTFTTPLTGVVAPGTYVTHCSGATSSTHYATEYVDGTIVVQSATLPPTGSDNNVLVMVAIALLALGGGLVGARRRPVSTR